MLNIPLRQIIIALLWSTFLSAGVACGLIFAWVDPSSVFNQLGIDPNNRVGGYSVAFFFFWIIGIANVSICLYFLRPISHGTNNKS